MHFYEKQADGSIVPRHFVDMTSRPGEIRPTRITDARKNRWVPSVTTIMGMLDKPALTDWKITEHLKQAYQVYSDEMREHHGEILFTHEYFIEKVKAMTQSELDRAPKDGTDFHDVLERYFSTEDISDMTKEQAHTCAMVDEALAHNCGLQGWITEKSFVHSLGYAGKVDVHAVDWVIDYKTKNTADKWKPGKMHYPEMAMQLAAYRVGLGLHNARCANVFVCIETGDVEFHEWEQDTLDKQWANFSDLLRIWLRNAEYKPAT